MTEGLVDDTQVSAEEQRKKLRDAERKGRRAVERKARQLERLQIEYVPLGSLHPNPYNPNRQNEHDFELLLRSMEEDGFTQPILAVRITQEHLDDPVFSRFAIGDQVIIDGEHRWQGAAKVGYTDIPVVFTDETPEQMRISTLRHNRARGSEDIELTAEILRDLQKLGAGEWALDSLMMSEVELNRLIEDVPAPEGLASDEYAEGWRPDKAGSDIAPVEGRESTHDSGTWTNASTSEALQAHRAREEALKDAKTQEQREMIQKDMSRGFYRVSLLLYGDDAEAVKEALKGAPAEALAELCRRELEKEAELADGTWVTIDGVIGRRTIPAESARVIREGLDEAERRGDVTDKSRFQAIEFWAGDYIAAGPDAAGP
jgi:ParB-like chromosome segregation protein Spo0J